MGDAYIARFQCMRIPEAARRSSDGGASSCEFLRQWGVMSAEKTRVPSAGMSVECKGTRRSTNVRQEWRTAEGSEVYRCGRGRVY